MSPADPHRAEAAGEPGGAAGAMLAALLVALGLVLQGYVWLLSARSLPDPSVQWLSGLPVAAEASAAAAAVNTRLVAVCLALLALAALLATAGSARLLPRALRPATARGLVLLGFLNFAVPFGGVICTLGAFALSRVLPANRARLAVSTVEEPEFAEYLIGAVSYGRGARLKAELRNAEASVDFRMTALLAMQSLPVRTVSPILQEMLADPLDDIRLLAYGSLESKEKALTQRITAERAALEALQALQAPGAGAGARPAEERARANKVLAELYGELIYQQLVTGDVYDNAIAQADRFAEAALALMPDDAALWRLRGRLALLRRDLEAADALLQRAIDSGFPRDRLLPYLAESAYWRRDFARVASLLGAMEASGVPPALRAALEFWQPAAAAPAPHADE
ncbi:sugar ABC transporter permease [Burkholderia glumae]|uniref:sugar ABC transporter permease n=1 Tax=Burkholderia glumae TaxID=337 RepID=UPI000C276DC5|nr:sugar ABC transporter permease [Burkholderia glumae]PJO21233.1 sugar ABC transporter permease [Burkholderia glumae AU6208]QGA40794.1 sugar ABC transporter permease [Burkholderia glumae]QHE13028.1 sugar ABC transporter permease [Burkholderia glumae AU6208]